MLGRLKHICFWLSLGRGHKGLVLEVGSGNSPHPRANVLCDRYPGETGHRHGAALLRDRPLVYADICALPFRTGVFDFVFSRHVLEHLESAQIPSALSELSRVARRLRGNSVAHLRNAHARPVSQVFRGVAQQDAGFSPKQQSFPFPPVAHALLGWRKKSKVWQRFVQENQNLWTIAFRWSNEISYRIESPRLYPAGYECTAEELWTMCDTAVAEAFCLLELGAGARRFSNWCLKHFVRSGGAIRRKDDARLAGRCLSPR